MGAGPVAGGERRDKQAAWSRGKRRNWGGGYWACPNPRGWRGERQEAWRGAQAG